jgi:outer membrane biosynthesis protein TonB
LVILFTLNPWPVWMKTQPIVYSVTLLSTPLSEPVIPKAEAMPAPKADPVEKKKPVEKPLKVEKPKPVEKPIEKPKKDDLVEKVKKPLPKVEKPDEEKETRQHLQEALEEIRRKVTLDEIRKRVAGREQTEERPSSQNAAGFPFQGLIPCPDAIREARISFERILQPALGKDQAGMDHPGEPPQGNG